MTNPDSQAGPEVPLPSSDAAVADKPAGTSPRKGPRRATAPAGAPAKTAVTAPALLVIGADGMIVPTSAATPAATGNAEAGNTEFGPAEAESTEAGNAETGTTAAEERDAASPAAKTTPQIDVPAEDESVGEATDTSAPATDRAGDVPAVGGNDAASATDDSTRQGPTGLEMPDAAATTAHVAPEAAPEEAADAPAVEAAPTVADETASEAEVPTTGTTEGEVEAGDGAEAESDATVPAANESGDGDSSPVPEDTPRADAPTEDEDDAAPLSRRERRLAEQRIDSDVEAADGAPATLPTGESNAAAGAKDGAKSGDAAAAEPGKAGATESTGTGVNRARPVRKRNRFVAFIRGLFFLVVISALVVGMGTVLTGNEEVAVGPSQTEKHRQAAWDATTALLAQTTALASTTGDPKIQDILAQAAKDLEVQVTALGDGLPPNTATPTPTATPVAPPTAAQLALALTTSGGELLTSSLTAEHAMGRVFAAAGTSQLLLGQNLGTADGGTAPATPFLPARVDFAAPVGPPCKSTLEPRPGTTIDAALRAAALAEQKAVYAYQVATTRFAEPQFSQSAALLQRHQAKLDALNAELGVRCLPLATLVAGFALDPAFTTTPKIALAGLEAELSGIYADLAALSTALPDDSAAIAAPSAAAAATQPPANTTITREIAVTWLLDSAQAQDSWGGTPAALAGMPEASAPAAPAAP